jgi:hypothetical protein
MKRLSVAAHVVSLALDIGRPRFNFTSVIRPLCSLADVCFEAHYGLKSDIAPCPKSAQ